MDGPLELQLSVEDAQATDVELQAMLTALAQELSQQGAEFLTGSPANGSASLEFIEKGIPGQSLIDIKIDLAALTGLIKWLRNRIAGTTTQIKLEHAGSKLEFEVRGDRTFSPVTNPSMPKRASPDASAPSSSMSACC